LPYNSNNKYGLPPNARFSWEAKATAGLPTHKSILEDMFSMDIETRDLEPRSLEEVRELGGYSAKGGVHSLYQITGAGALDPKNTNAEVRKLIKEEARGVKQHKSPGYADGDKEVSFGMPKRVNTFFAIPDDIKTPSSTTGVWNLSFEAAAEERVFGPGNAASPDFIFRSKANAPRTMAGKSSRVYSTHMDTAAAGFRADDMYSKFLRGETDLLSHREATLDYARKTVKTLSGANNTPDIYHVADQEAVGSGFLALIEKEAGINFKGNYELTTKLDQITKAMANVTEIHGASADALDAGTATNIMSRFLGTDDTRTLDPTEVAYLKRVGGELSKSRLEKSAKALVEEAKQVKAGNKSGLGLPALTNEEMDIGDMKGSYGDRIVNTYRHFNESSLDMDYLDTLRDNKGDPNLFRNTIRERVHSRLSASSEVTDKSVDSVTNNVMAALNYSKKEAAEKFSNTNPMGLKASLWTGLKHNLGERADKLLGGKDVPGSTKALRGFGYAAGALAAVGTLFLGIRQAFATNFNEFEAMKQHADSDFYGGRAPFNTFSMMFASSPFNPLFRGINHRNASLYFNPQTDNWGRASQYGVSTEYMWGSISGDHEEEMDAKQQSIVMHGTYMHEQFQSKLERYVPGAMSEYAIKDKNVRLTGHVDMVIPMKFTDGKTYLTPLEVKTVGEKALAGMKAPKEEHIAQAQFYLHNLAKNNPDAPAPFETFVYIAREDPGIVKTFTVKRDERAFRKYLKRYRAYQHKLDDEGFTPQRLSPLYEIDYTLAKQAPLRNKLRSSDAISPGQLKEIISSVAGSYTPTAYGGKSTFKAIRQSYPTNPGEFEAIKSHPGTDFPGGRINLFRMHFDLSTATSAFTPEDISKINKITKEDIFGFYESRGYKKVTGSYGVDAEVKKVILPANVLGNGPDSWNKDVKLSLLHEALELSAAETPGALPMVAQIKGGGGHYSKAVILEEKRLSDALGGDREFMKMRAKDYYDSDHSEEYQRLLATTYGKDLDKAVLAAHPAEVGLVASHIDKLPAYAQRVANRKQVVHPFTNVKKSKLGQRAKYGIIKARTRTDPRHNSSRAGVS